MADRSGNSPSWAQRAVQAAPELWVYQLVGPVLPSWMMGSQQAWNEMRKAKVPHPGRWVRATDTEALKGLPAARRLLVDIIHAHVQKHRLEYGWVASQAELEAACLPLPPAPEHHRFVLRAGIDEVDLKDPACAGLSQGSISLMLEAWKAGDLVEAEPVPVCPYLSYWVALVQTTSGAKLMVLATDRAFEIRLASPGPVTIWAHGQEQTLVLPVAAARLDPGEARLGHAIAYCQHHGLALPAFRPPESGKVRGDAD